MSCPSLTRYHLVLVLRPGTQWHTGCVHTLLPYFGTTTSNVIRYSEFRTKSSLCTMSDRVRVSRFPLCKEDKVKITVAGAQQWNIGGIVLWVDKLIEYTGVEEGLEGGT